MAETFAGECQCGAVKYRVSGRSATLFACHCSECQRQSASAFGMALWIKDYQLELSAGEMKRWRRTTPSGRQLNAEFCPTCGTRLFHQLDGQSEIISIKPGTLSATKTLEPVAHIWVRSAQSWVQIPRSCLQYPENPDDFDALFRAWDKRKS